MKLFSLVFTVALYLHSSNAAASHGQSAALKKIHTNKSHHFNESLAATSLEKRYSGSGIRFSYYYPEKSGNAVACGQYETSQDYIVALSQTMFTMDWCNKPITLEYQGKTISAMIVDECQSCPYAGLDLTPVLFTQLGDISAGYLWGGQWSVDGEGPQTTTTTTHKATTSTTHHTTPTSTSTTSTTSSTHISSSSSSLSSSSSSSPASASTSASSPSQSATALGNINALYQAMLGLGNVALAAA